MPQRGALEASGDPFEPFRLLDASGRVLKPAAAFLKELQAGGRSATTQRSYGLALLRWFRFLTAIEVPWDQATRVEARDFSRWIQTADKPGRPHWRRRGEPAAAARPASTNTQGSPNLVTGENDNPIWPHRDGLFWPHCRSGILGACLGGEGGDGAHLKVPRPAR